MVFSESLLTSFDSTRLYVRRYEPQSAGVERHLILVHGLCEHGGRYRHVIDALTAFGWTVIVKDLRGHGKSGGVRTHVSSFEDYQQDLHVVFAHFRLDPARTAILGHSMGGLLAARFAQSAPATVAAVALVSPLLALKVAIPAWTLMLGRVLRYIAPKIRFQSCVDPYDSTRNVAAIESRLADPLVERSVTAGWYFAMQEAVRAAWRQAPSIQTPMLLMQAGDDRIVDPDSAEPWLHQVGSGDRQYRLIPGALHELLNEPEWRQTIAAISAWLTRRIR